jgi:hypothetical protein
MPQQSVKKIITNRQLNFTLSPDDKHNHKEMPYALNNYEIDGTWNNHQSIILDVILDLYLKSYYKEFKALPKSWRSRNVIEKTAGSFELIKPEIISYMSMSPKEAYAKHYDQRVFENLKKRYEESKRYDPERAKSISFEQFVDQHFEQNGGYKSFVEECGQKATVFHYDSPFNIDRVKICENYDILNKYRYTLDEYLRSIAATKFKLNYKIKYLQRPPQYDDNGKRTDKGELIDLHYRMREFQHLFLVNFTEDKIILNFDTPLGKLVLHNMLVLDTDWIPVEALELPKNAYFLYKRFVLNRVSGRRKSKNVEIKYADAKAFLDLNWDNDRGVHGIIAKALGHIVENGLAEGLEWRGSPVSRRIYTLRFEKREKEQQVEPLKFSELSN